MLERRQQTRFHPGTTLSVTFHPEGQTGHEGLHGQVEDVSSKGFKVLMPEHFCRGLMMGQTLKGTLHSEDNNRAWVGNITHLHPRTGGISVGIALTTNYADPAPLKETIEQVVQNPKTGGITLRRVGDNLILDVIGYLSLALGRDFLHLVRGSSLAAIDLSQCKGMDSAGLGMLCIATDAHIPLINTHGAVKELLDVARIPLAQATSSAATPITSNPIRASRTLSGRDPASSHNTQSHALPRRLLNSK